MGLKITFTAIFTKLFLFLWLLLLPLCVLAEHRPSDDKHSILVFTAYGDKFAQTYQGIKDDLGDDFSVVIKIIESDTSIKSIKNYIDNTKPALIVLLGNAPARKYTNYQKQYPKQNFPPSIVMSALYVDRLLRQMKNTQGIRHEIPAVTSIASIRSLVKKPIKKVGVLYRRWMKEYIQLNRYFCMQEGIELVAVEIPNKISVKSLSYNLRHLLKDNIDALWIVNDNALIRSKLVQNVWLPNISKFNKPVIVGLEGLMKTALDFGTFAVIPDQYALGIQGAGLISDIIDDQIKSFKENKVYEPISVKKSLNIHLMRKRNIALNQSKLETLDKLIE